MKPGDIKQGILGDCWFLRSLMVFGLYPELLQNLIVKAWIKYGFAVFQFFKNGEWKQVLVDTRISYNRETKTPLYGHWADPTEVWVSLIKKHIRNFVDATIYWTEDRCKKPWLIWLEEFLKRSCLNLQKQSKFEISVFCGKNS